MNTRPALLLAALAALALPAAGRAAADPYKLKKGAAGQLCFGCHVKFEAQLKKPAVHTPVKARECTGCHSPHASQHGKLLADAAGRTCARCHGDVVPREAKSTHRPAAENACGTCHAPHASDVPKVLTQPVGALCASCHQDVAKAAADARVKHRPLQPGQGGCTTCHDPHASTTATALLKKPEPQLCVGCHKTDKPIFAKWHMGYAVGGARCTSCHDPHGSSQKGMLFDKVHAPIAKGMCAQCHESPGAAAGFKTKQRGSELCARCHAQTVEGMLAKGTLHQPVVEGDGCLNCHDAHASRGKGLLATDAATLCGRCHGDTAKRHDRSPTKHEPIAQGSCSACHDPHASDNDLLFKRATVTETCGQCHDWQKHASHPMGEKVIDPRNKNRQVECLSCHRSHGTEFKRLMPFVAASDLCTKCHEQYKR